MARYIGPVCRQCRREGAKLLLEGRGVVIPTSVPSTVAPNPPGQHGQRRMKFTEYGIRLREKQKVRRMYGMVEKQFRRYFHEADRVKGRGPAKSCSSCSSAVSTAPVIDWASRPPAPTADSWCGTST